MHIRTTQKKNILKIYKILKTNYYKYKKQKNKDNIPKEKIFTNIRKNADWQKKFKNQQRKLVNNERPKTEIQKCNNILLKKTAGLLPAV